MVLRHSGHTEAGPGPVEEPRQADGRDNGDDPTYQEVHRDQHIAEEQGFQRKNDREGPHGGTEHKQHQTAQQDQQADSDHDHREHRFTDQLCQENPFDYVPDQPGQNQRQRYRQPKAKPRLHRCEPDDEPADDHKFALREVEHFTGAVNHDKAHGHQRIQKADQSPGNDVIDEVNHFRRPPLRFGLPLGGY